MSGTALATALFLSGGTSGSAFAQELPPLDKAIEGYTKLESADLQDPKTLFTVWKRDRDQQMLLELPKNFMGKRYFIALTVSSGDLYAGLQSGDWVVEWRRYNDRIAMLVPNLEVRASGDPEGKASVKRLFTDQVILDMPIVALGPNGGPVIDADDLLVGNASRFFGNSVQVTNPRLKSISKAKVFPKNVEIAYEIVGAGGALQSLHYSFSEVPGPGSFKPRKADERVGYFTTAYSDLGIYDDEKTRVRYINRWHLEKRDPRLKVSPPKEPIRFYVEHTTPVRYRRYVKEGAEFWNKAFEKVGIIGAIEVQYQDAESGLNMEKDPEDVRYNFIRWLNNDIGTAIGPSRVHPETGQILDADVVLTDGWIRHYNFNYNELLPQLAMEGVSAETLAWLGQNPNWDPRVRLADPANRNYLASQYLNQSFAPNAGHPFLSADSHLIGDQEYDGLYGRVSQVNGYCSISSGRQMDLALARMNWELVLLAQQEGAGEKPEEPKKEEPKKEEESLIDGMPEWFVGPLLADLVAHEVGHTLGLRHNFKASALYTLDQINSEELKGKKTFSASVMDYVPINYRLEAGAVQGDYGMLDIGPYDFWAIEYGYVDDEKKLADILKRCSEPELQYATDEDTMGPDPLARRYDFAKDPLAYAEEQLKLVKYYRGRLLDKFVKDGDSWAKARRGYELTLGIQTRAVNMMAGWVGGAFVNRDKKGDPGNRNPLEVVPAEQQRKALDFVIQSTFKDDAYGLSPDLLAKMSIDQWMDDRGTGGEATWPIHDRILGIQASTLTMLMNPTTLRRVYDNEVRVAADQDVLTLPEMLNKVSEEAWTELKGECPADVSTRKPMITSLRQNLQREHLERLVDLIIKPNTSTAAFKPISNLAAMQLRELKVKVDHSLNTCGDKMDAYTKAHLVNVQQQIDRALSAAYTIGGQNANPLGGIRILGNTPEATSAPAAE
jgi:hypothetical protein